jgi:hypothetical protein
MDNLEKLKIFGTHGTVRKQNKYYTETLKDEKRLTPRTPGPSKPKTMKLLQR